MTEKFCLEIIEEELYKKSKSTFSWCFCRYFAKAGFQFNVWVRVNIAPWFIGGFKIENLLSERLKLENEGVYFPCPKTMPPSAKVNFHPYTRGDTPTH